MHLVGAGQVLVGGGDDRAVRVLQTIQPRLEPLHGDSAQVDDVVSAGAFVRGIEKGLAPFLVASQAVPVFALAPLLVVWLVPETRGKTLEELERELTRGCAR